MPNGFPFSASGGDLRRNQRRTVLWTAAGAAVAIGIIAWTVSARGHRPRRTYGIKVDPGCNTFEVTSEADVRREVEIQVKSAIRRGAPNPFDITSAFLRKAAPHCTFFPSNTRNLGEATLYVMTFNTVLQTLLSHNLLSQDQANMFHQMLEIWAVNQGIPAEEFQ